MSYFCSNVTRGRGFCGLTLFQESSPRQARVGLIICEKKGLWKTVLALDTRIANQMKSWRQPTAMVHSIPSAMLAQTFHGTAS